MRTLSARLKGSQPGPEASIRKLLADEHGQNVMLLARDLIGASAMLVGSLAGDYGDLDDGIWQYGFMFAQALTIGGGTFAVQRNIVGERVLGLPHDIDVTAGLNWSQAQRAAH
jgi:alkylation response protein AidB-like acyl-CoA dehydrogenase